MGRAKRGEFCQVGIRDGVVGRRRGGARDGGSGDGLA